MKFRIIVALAGLLGTASAHALTVESYEQLKKKVDVDTTVRMSLFSYFQGVAETFLATSDATTGQINLRSGDTVCMPAGVKLGADLVEAAVQQEITDHRAIHMKTPDWDQIYVSIYAGYGLVRMFPCTR
ncbi:hypothetical protein ACLB90_01430 [Stenotrophomonas sp. LGBM10]|uniref:hypothetical protein n=1 Tax=Stenotrophomonas sp. LGBM10 TaxID=3390038 RepID=UPI00398AEDA4